MTVAAGVDTTVDEFVRTGSFTDLNSNSGRIAIEDYGDGSGIRDLPLNADADVRPPR